MEDGRKRGASPEGWHQRQQSSDLVLLRDCGPDEPVVPRKGRIGLTPLKGEN